MAITKRRNGRHRLADVVKQPIPPSNESSPFIEIGSTGLLRYSGYINEEFLRDLQGQYAVKIYKEMASNSPTVGACLRAVIMLMRGVSWRVEPGGDSIEDTRAQELIETAKDDMSMSWLDTLAEIFSALTYGFSYHELVYKRRQGQQREPGLSSRYDDGLIGWRKMPIRAQESKQRWEFGDDGGIKGMWQQVVDKPGQLLIPIEKAILFRPDIHKNNPEGQSVLRTAYQPYYYLKRIQEIEAVGIERDLAGYPMGFVPPEVLSSSRTGAQSAMYTALKNFVVNIRRDEQEGGLWPLAYDAQGKLLYDFKLLSTGGTRQFNTTEVIQRYQRDIAMSVMADFLFLGREQVGSFALASSKTTLFAAALGAWLDQIADVFNRHAIPRLLGLNGMLVEKLPTLAHGDIESQPVEEIAQMITAMAQSGARLFPDMNLENHFRERMGWPELTEQDFAQRDADQLAAEQQRAEAKAELLQANADRQQQQAQPQPEIAQKQAPIQIINQMPAPAAPTVELKPTFHLHQPAVTVEGSSLTVEPAIVQPPVINNLPASERPRPRRYVAKQRDGETVIEVDDGS